jgi:hypothetical protein
MKTFQRCLRVRQQQVGSETMLFDDSCDAVHVLNGSAAFIWECIRTPITATQIEACLRKEYDLSIVSDVPAMIAGILCDFEKKNLLEADHPV